MENLNGISAQQIEEDFMEALKYLGKNLSDTEKFIVKSIQNDARFRDLDLVFLPAVLCTVKDLYNGAILRVKILMGQSVKKVRDCECTVINQKAFLDEILAKHDESIKNHAKLSENLRGKLEYVEKVLSKTGDAPSEAARASDLEASLAEAIRKISLLTTERNELSAKLIKIRGEVEHLLETIQCRHASPDGSP